MFCKNILLTITNMLLSKQQAEPEGPVPEVRARFALWNRAFRRGHVL
ncbi:hypothetical protein [Psychromonas sp. MB-3u-54]|nr:hypothetical protein [Psychromonas sp. MB-3u-54]